MLLFWRSQANSESAWRLVGNVLFDGLTKNAGPQNDGPSFFLAGGG